MKFQDLWKKFSFLFGQLCDKKTCAFVVMGTGNKVEWAGGGMFCVCGCLWGGEWAGWA